MHIHIYTHVRICLYHICMSIYISISMAILAQGHFGSRGGRKQQRLPQTSVYYLPRSGIIISPLLWPSATSSTTSTSHLPHAASSLSSPGSDLRVSQQNLLQGLTISTTPPSTIPCTEVKPQRPWR